MELNKFLEKYFDPNDDSGFNEMIFERQAKIKSLRERLKKYYLTEKELDNLFKIIEKAEMDIEKVKRSFKKKDYTKVDLFKFQKKILEIQVKMKTEFEEKLSKTLKEKYEKAKKIKAELDKKNPYLQ